MGKLVKRMTIIAVLEPTRIRDMLSRARVVVTHQLVALSRNVAIIALEMIRQIIGVRIRVHIERRMMMMRLVPDHIVPLGRVTDGEMLIMPHAGPLPNGELSAVNKTH